MKRIYLLPLFAGVLMMFSCGGEEKNNQTNENNQKLYQIDPESVVLNWTAYKTTDKVPVGGEFGKINVEDVALAEKMEGAIDNVSFSVHCENCSDSQYLEDCN